MGTHKLDCYSRSVFLLRYRLSCELTLTTNFFIFIIIFNMARLACALLLVCVVAAYAATIPETRTKKLTPEELPKEEPIKEEPPKKTAPKKEAPKKLPVEKEPKKTAPKKEAPKKLPVEEPPKKTATKPVAPKKAAPVVEKPAAKAAKEEKKPVATK